MVQGNLIQKKTLSTSLFSIFGIGKIRSKKLVSCLGVKLNASLKSITTKQNFKLSRMLKNFCLQKDLKFNLFKILCFEKKSLSYGIIRRFLGLPLRGNSRNNGHTAKSLRLLLAVTPFSANQRVMRVKKLDKRLTRENLIKKTRKQKTSKKNSSKGKKAKK